MLRCIFQFACFEINKHPSKHHENEKKFYSRPDYVLWGGTHIVLYKTHAKLRYYLNFICFEMSKVWWKKKLCVQWIFRCLHTNNMISIIILIYDPNLNFHSHLWNHSIVINFFVFAIWLNERQINDQFQ